MVIFSHIVSRYFAISKLGRWGLAFLGLFALPHMLQGITFQSKGSSSTVKKEFSAKKKLANYLDVQSPQSKPVRIVLNSKRIQNYLIVLATFLVSPWVYALLREIAEPIPTLHWLLMKKEKAKLPFIVTTATFMIFAILFQIKKDKQPFVIIEYQKKDPLKQKIKCFFTAISKKIKTMGHPFLLLIPSTLGFTTLTLLVWVSIDGLHTKLSIRNQDKIESKSIFGNDFSVYWTQKPPSWDRIFTERLVKGNYRAIVNEDDPICARCNNTKVPNNPLHIFFKDQKGITFCSTCKNKEVNLFDKQEALLEKQNTDDVLCSTCKNKEYKNANITTLTDEEDPTCLICDATKATAKKDTQFFTFVPGLFCPVCYKPFNKTDRKAILHNSCVTPVCLECIATIEKNKCAICRQPRPNNAFIEKECSIYPDITKGLLHKAKQKSKHKELFTPPVIRHVVLFVDLYKYYFAALGFSMLAFF